MANLVDLYLVYRILRRLTQPFTEWEAYKQGVIDAEGNILKKSDDRKTPDEKESFTKFDLLILKLKKLLGTVPFGKTKIASYIAALWFLKEEKRLTEDNLQEEFEKFCIKEKFLSEAKVDKHEMSGIIVIDGYVVNDSGREGRSTYGRYTVKDPDYKPDPKEKGMHRNYRKPSSLSFSTMAEVKKWIKTQPKKSAAEIEAVHKKYAEREKMYTEEASVNEANQFAIQGHQVHADSNGMKIYHGGELVHHIKGDFSNPTKMDRARVQRYVTNKIQSSPEYKTKRDSLLRKEEAPANVASSGAVAGLTGDPPVGKKAQQKYTKKFANNDVFVVSSETYNKARLGKRKFVKYETYVGNDEVGNAIREYGRKYPKKPIILQDGENGPMIFLRRGRNTFKEHLELTENVSQSDLKGVESYADKLFKALNIDIEFTKHFLDRVNDARNKKDITVDELQALFRKTYHTHGKKIPKMGPDAEAVIADMASDVNLPFVLKWDKDSEELDLVAKTVMRKKNFMTSSPKLKV